MNMDALNKAQRRTAQLAGIVELGLVAFEHTPNVNTDDTLRNALWAMNDLLIELREALDQMDPGRGNED